ncbi:hypothetical protein Daus18300_007640 [Diaporthe australafricana]|uniref:Uncharacterized protein n=1 Tax=Diaporthe australafricana TaxID=127596 RepID=A0ABR3WL94_9PEZI
MSNNNNNTSGPGDPSSALSKKARLAHWITGGTGRSPSTMSSFTRMTRDRNDVKKANEAWRLSRERALGEHQQQWGRSGFVGAVDQARGTAPKPKGMALIRWYRDGRGGLRAEHENVAGQPEQQQQEQQEQQQTRLEEDIYGAHDDAVREGTERGNTGDADAAAGTVNGDTVGPQQTAAAGDDHNAGSPAQHTQQ